jgi:hypothetical protein
VRPSLVEVTSELAPEEADELPVLLGDLLQRTGLHDPAAGQHLDPGSEEA